MELRIQFKGGGTYKYTAVPGDHVAKLIFAESPGKYFNAFIKGLYDCVKLDPKESE
jgi:hypothetical protein